MQRYKIAENRQNRLISDYHSGLIWLSYQFFVFCFLFFVRCNLLTIAMKIAKQQDFCCLAIVEPFWGLEPQTYALRMRCSTN